jgi:hypothetical protein
LTQIPFCRDSYHSKVVDYFTYASNTILPLKTFIVVVR